MRVVGYLRVSTASQAEEGLGLEVQQGAIKSWAAEHSHRVTRFHRDEGISGANGLDSRVGLLEALEDVKVGRASGIVVYRLDRLARDLILQETLLREIKRWGGELFSTSAGEAAYLTDDADDPSRTLIRQILGAVSEYERAMIVMRLRAGRRRKSENGGYAYGAPPYGWRAEDGELVPVPHEQDVIARARELRDGGGSLRSIAAHLEDEGFRPRRGGRWHPAVISRLLKKPVVRMPERIS